MAIIESEVDLPGVPNPEDVNSPAFEGQPGVAVGVSTPPTAVLGRTGAPVSKNPGQWVWVPGRGWRVWSRICQGALVVPESGNTKIGFCATTYASQESCPRNCPSLAGNGCYAETDKVYVQTRELNESGLSERVVAEQEAYGLRALARATKAQLGGVTTGQVLHPLRIHTVGDCRSREAARMVSAAAMEYLASPLLHVNRKLHVPGAVPVWTYTHAWTVHREDWQGVSVLKSVHTMRELERADREGWACATVVDDYPNGPHEFQLGGFIAMPCMNIATRALRKRQGKPPVACEECQWCWADQWLRAERRVVAFKAHGAAAIQAKQSTIGKAG